ncbi:unnamed protein product [marine sediment metagenome]|uniref:DUF2283 domain-containing protein n=1 Tax=marine sediment metagenome TaxID=412755 RepID=X1SCI8_9ZZZZ
MKVIYDPENDILNLILREIPIKESDELREGIIIDYGEDGKVVSIEMFDASENVTEPRGVLFELKETKVNTP